jgi:hypothetical protein
MDVVDGRWRSPHQAQTLLLSLLLLLFLHRLLEAVTLFDAIRGWMVRVAGKWFLAFFGVLYSLSICLKCYQVMIARGY